MFMKEDEDSEILDMIQKLMHELSEKMEYSTDDFESRLGRKKPDVDVTLVKGEMPEKEMMEDEDDAMEDEDHMEDLGDDLKSRLMRLRKG